MPRSVGEGGTDERGLAPVLLVAGIVFGLVARLVVLAGPLGRPDADEVIAGLMARHLGSDGFPLFFWGQHYGGTPEILPVALSMKVFGASVVAMRIPTFVLAAANSVLVWRLATRFLTIRGAQLAGVLSWVGAAPAVWLSVREMLFYVPTVTLGLIGAICAFRWIEGGERPATRRAGRAWDGVGMVVTVLVGVWLSPNIVYFAVPTAIVVLQARGDRRRAEPRAGSRARSSPGPSAGPRSRRSATIGVAVAVALVVGWLLMWQVTSRAAALAPLDRALDPGGYPSRLVFLVARGLPGLLGTRVLFTHDWIAGPLGVVVYLLVLLVIVVGLRAALRGWSWDGVGLAAFPFLFALVPKAVDQPNLRYTSFLVPFVAMVVARVATTGRTERWRSIAAVAVAAAMTVVGLQRAYVVSEVDRTVRVGNVGDLDEVVAVLDQHHLHAAFASYWISFRLAFETGERIVAVQPWDEQRYEPYLDQVMADPARAWVVERGSSRDELVAALTHAGVAVTEVPAGDFVVVLTDRPVDPTELQGPIRTRL